MNSHDTQTILCVLVYGRSCASPEAWTARCDLIVISVSHWHLEAALVCFHICNQPVLTWEDEKGG